ADRRAKQTRRTAGFMGSRETFYHLTDAGFKMPNPLPRSRAKPAIVYRYVPASVGQRRLMQLQLQTWVEVEAYLESCRASFCPSARPSSTVQPALSAPTRSAPRSSRAVLVRLLERSSL